MTTNKAKQALIAYANAKGVYDAKSREIGDAINKCFLAQDASLEARYGLDWVLRASYVEHLKLAYEIDGSWGERDYTNHDGDVDAYLEEACPHCLAAHRAIQERKTLRQELGKTKRRITRLANSLAKSGKD